MADVKFTLSTIDDFTNKLKKLEDSLKKVNGEATKLSTTKFNNFGNIAKTSSSINTQKSINLDYTKALKEVELKQKQVAQAFFRKEKADLAEAERIKSKIGAFTNYNRNIVNTSQNKIDITKTANTSWLSGKTKYKSFESDYDKALKERFGYSMSESEKQRQMNEMFKKQEAAISSKALTDNQILSSEIKQRNNALDATRKYNQEYVNNLQKKVIADKKRLEKEEKEARKLEAQRTKLNQKISDSFKNAKVTPINYVTDGFGRVIGVSKAGGSESATIFSSNKMGGKTVQEKTDRGLGSNVFMNTAKAYGSYRVINATERGFSSLAQTPLQLEQIRASIGAMLFASGTKRSELDKGVEDEMSFIYKMSQKYGSDPVEIAKNYSMALSTMATKTPGRRNMTRDELRSITEGFLNVSRVSGLDKEATGSVFLALSQMLGKQKIQAQEVNLQMSQRIPAIKNILLKTIEETTKDPRMNKMYSRYQGKSLDELMEKGVISSDVLVNFEKVVNTIFDDMYKEKGKTLGAESVRLGASFKELTDITTKEMLPTFASVVRGLNAGVQFINKGIQGSEGKAMNIINDPNKTFGEKASGLTYKGVTDIALPSLLGFTASSLVGKGLGKLGLRAAPALLSNPAILATFLAGTAGVTLYNELTTPNKDFTNEKLQKQIKDSSDSMNQTNEPKLPEISINLKIENSNFGLIPSITTSDGKKLNLGKNIIAGERKNYAN